MGTHKPDLSNARTFVHPLLGYETVTAPFGFAPLSRPHGNKEALAFHEGGSHMLTIGCTSSGKTTLIMDMAMTYRGQMIILDLKADIARCTARFRSTLGPVNVWDPFNASGLGNGRAKINIFAPTGLPGTELESECRSIADTLFGEQRTKTREVFWPEAASDLTSALFAHIIRNQGEQPAVVADAMRILFAEDPVYNLATLMDAKVVKNSYEAGAIAQFLSMPDITRGGVMATAASGVSCLRSPLVQESLGRSTFSMSDFIDNKPMTFYLVLPLHHLNSHSTVLRLVLETLCQALLRRTRQYEVPTLLVVDEAAQLGSMPLIRTISTYLRGYGVKLHLLFQDGSQLTNLYNDWPTLMNNTSLRTFMPGSDGLASKQIAEMAGVDPRRLAELRKFEQLVCETGRAPRVVRIPQYWRDPLFKGRWDAIERYEPIRTPQPIAR